MMPTYTLETAIQMFEHRLQNLLGGIQLFPDWEMKMKGPATGFDAGGRVHVYVEVSLPPRVNAVPGTYFNPYARFAGCTTIDSAMSEREILARCLSYLITLHEHECLEFFHYKNRAWISPHRNHANTPWDFLCRQNLHYEAIMTTCEDLLSA